VFGHARRAMVIGAIIAACIVLFLLALLAPRLSIWPQRGVSKALGTGAHGGSKAPGPVGQSRANANSTRRALPLRGTGARVGLTGRAT
jgi:hypothetical protein